VNEQSGPSLCVGLPVHNGGRFLRAGLDCLRAQTFRDFEVLIYDNASTDDTAAIALDFAARDSRFHYHRQPVNKGAMQNFTDVLLAARSPFFMWRAADDASDANYLEVLHGLLLARPDKDLAVSRILTRAYDGSLEREQRYRGECGWRGPIGLAVRAFRSNRASWFYGLFRRAAITPIWLDIASRYREANASDHLALFPFLFDNRIIGTNATTFIQGVQPKNSGITRPRGPDRHDAKIAQRRAFLDLTREEIVKRLPDPAVRAPYGAIAWFYANSRVCPWRKVLRRAAQRRFYGILSSARG
jgi:glycosyltransferase involved in cell wall biosynthesis